MRSVAIIAGRELRAYLLSMRAYAVTAVFLLISGVYFYGYLVQTRFAYTTLDGFFEAARVMSVIFAAFLTMGSFADERRDGTLELLLAAPIPDAAIVCGKFLAGMLLYAAMLGLTLVYPLLLGLFGDPDLGPIATGYLGLMLLGAVCLAAGVFAASWAPNQIVAAVVCLALLFALFYVGAAAPVLPEGAERLAASLSMTSHFASFSRGVLDSADLVYHVTLCGGFLFLANENVAAERWR